jgi:hypothetical protein
MHGQGAAVHQDSLVLTLRKNLKKPKLANHWTFSRWMTSLPLIRERRMLGPEKSLSLGYYSADEQCLTMTATISRIDKLHLTVSDQTEMATKTR